MFIRIPNRAVKYLLFFLFVQLVFINWGQNPSNDNCFGAISLSPSSSCLPLTGTTSNATQSFIGCTGVANDDVWYSFTATQANLAVQVSGTAGFNPVVEVFSGGCSNNSSLACVNNTANGGTEIASLTNLIIGVTYTVRVYHFANTAPSTPNFTICVSPIATIPSCLTATPAGNTCSQTTLICNVDGYCGSTSANYTADYWPELNAAFCGSIENNSFVSFVANASIVSLNVWVTSSTQNNGIQMMVFSAQNCAGPVNTFACYSPMPPSPNAQVVTIAGLTAGSTYYLMIDGYAGDVCNYVIGVNSGILVSGNISASQTNICLGNSVTLTASGGDGNYNWASSPDLSASSGNSITATPASLGPNSYTMTTNSSNPLCPSVSTSGITINVFDTPTPNAGIDDTVCLGTPIYLQGQASNSVNLMSWNFNTQGISPTPQVSFYPNFSSLSPTVTVNQPGLYNFILRETSSICGISRDTVRILVLDTTVSAQVTPPSCSGSVDGQLEILSPYANTFSIDNGLTWQAQALFSNLQAGIYPICASLPFGCQTCSTATITNPNSLQLTATNDTVICQNGTATIQALGEGPFSYTYYWQGLSSANSSVEIQSSQDTSIFVFAVSDFGCYTDTVEVLVMINPPLSASLTPSQSICHNAAAILSAVASGGNGGPYTFNWQSISATQGLSSNITVSPEELTTYVVQISDGCESTPLSLSSQISIIEITPLIEASSYTACEPAMFFLTNLTPVDQVQSLLWEINGIEFTNNNEILLSSLMAGVYDVSLVLTTPEGCVDSTIYQDYLTVFPKPVASFMYSPSELNMFNTNTVLINTSSESDQLSWSVPMGLPSSSTEAIFPISFPDGISGNYEVSLQVVSENGCVDSITQIVQVKPDILIYAPNTFTPDGDEHNNLWYIQTNGIDIYNYNLKILNRWGETIWLSTDPNEKWDGYYMGNPIQEGAYSWFLMVKDPENDGSYNYNGFVNILR